MIRTRPAPMNCDAIAPFYNALEHLSFGNYLERCRTTFLPETTKSRSAIVCGGGDGRFLAHLLRVNSCVEVDFVELSLRMVRLAKQRVARMGPAFLTRVRFHVADIRDFVRPPGSYNLIVTHFFLDCFSDPELADVVARLSSWATPGARWIVSDFCEARGPIAQVWTRLIVRSLYAAFKFTTGLRVTRLPDYAGAVAGEGYLLRFERQTLKGLFRSSLWEQAASSLTCRGRARS